MSGKILRARIESYRGLINTNISWDDHRIMAFIGDGGAGKSSGLEFFESCFSAIIPKDARNPITGVAKGEVDIQIDGKEYTIFLSKTKKTETVKIKSSDNMMGGKETIRKVVGELGVNPLELKKMKPVDQIDWVKKVCKINTTEIDTRRKNVYDTRTGVNNKMKDLKGYLLSHEMASLDPAVLDDKVVRLAEPKELGNKNQQLLDAIESNRDVEEKKRELLTLGNDRILIEKDTVEIERQITLLQERIKFNEQQLLKLANEEQIREEWLKHHEPTDIKALQDEIEAINNHNLERAEFLAYKEKMDEQKAAYEQAKQLTDQLKVIDEERESYIRSKMIAVPGMKVLEKKYDSEGNLTDDREGIFVDEKPISYLSTTESLKFGMRLRSEINKQEGNAGLSLIMIDDFESVGTKGREELIRLCQEENYYALVAEMKLNVPELKVVLKHTLSDEAEETLATKDAPAAKNASKKINNTAKAINSSTEAVATEEDEDEEED